MRHGGVGSSRYADDVSPGSKQAKSACPPCRSSPATTIAPQLGHEKGIKAASGLMPRRARDEKGRDDGPGGRVQEHRGSAATPSSGIMWGRSRDVRHGGNAARPTATHTYRSTVSICTDVTASCAEE